MFEGNSKEFNHYTVLMTVLLQFCLMGDEYYGQLLIEELKSK